MDSVAAHAMPSRAWQFVSLGYGLVDCALQICMLAAYDRDKNFRFHISAARLQTEFSSPPEGGGNPDSSPSAGDAVTTATSPVSFLRLAPSATPPLGETGRNEVLRLR